MKKMLLVLLVGLTMVGCEAKNEEVVEEPKEAPVKVEEQQDKVIIADDGTEIRVSEDGEKYIIDENGEKVPVLTEEDLGYDPFSYICEVCGEPNSTCEDDGHTYCYQHYCEACGWDDEAARWDKNLFIDDPSVLYNHETGVAEKVVYKKISK